MDLSHGDNLGLMIRGGAEYGLGIFVTEVEERSMANINRIKVRIRNQGFLEYWIVQLNFWSEKNNFTY